MKRLALAFAISLSLIVSGCASFPKDDIEIATEADPKTNFSGYKTYAWLGAAAILNDPEGKWEPPGFDADSFIVSVIDRELTKRGMSETSKFPDMLIAYALGVDTEMMKFQEDSQADVSVLENVPSGALVIVMMLVARSWESVAPEAIQVTNPHGPDVNVQFSDHGESQAGDALRDGDLPGLREMQQQTDARTQEVADALAETNQ